jgi:nucleotide-binding universal stress UspA family protein
MLKRLLIPLDGSTTAEAALAIANVIPCDQVRILHVRPELPTADYDWIASLQAEEWNARRDASARVYLDRVAEPLRAQGRAVETTVATGDVAGRIANSATDADLVVMTTQGHGAVQPMQYGSVADRISRISPTPMLLIRAGDQPVVAPPIARILVPLDGSALAEQALPMAMDLAADLGLPVHLIRVVDLSVLHEATTMGAYPPEALARTEETMKSVSAAYLAEQANALRERDLPVTREVRVGPAAPELLKVIRRGDLVVMTAHGHGGARQWLLGSVAYKLINLAKGPVLLVRPGMPAPDAQDAANAEKATISE